MTVYVATPAVDRFWQLSLDENVLSGNLAALRFNGSPIGTDWPILEAEWIEDDAEQKPDIAHMLSGSLVLSPKAKDALKGPLSNLAEFLPINVAGELWSVLNVLNRLDVLDREKSKLAIRSNGSLRVTEPVLDESKVTDGRLFKCEGLSVPILTTDGPGTLKSLVESNGLTGLAFVPFERA
ncbi:MAG: hypothetical protein II007_02990 [Gammaproteobacteria bacterium]|nr:hypothetical protein [Gammaproteobacteria bacterium]